MTNKLVTMTAVAALALSPAVALAHSAAPAPATPPTVVAPENPSTTAPPEAMPTAPAPGTSATVAPTTARFVSQQAPDQWLGSELIGTAVVTSNDEKLGSISDLVMEKDGRAVAAVIDVGGFLGIGAKPVAVSFDSLTMAPTDGGQKIVVSLTKEELNQAPEFKNLAQARAASGETKTQ
ncbi:PRC-barrel domain-containing protein [Ancylobacter sp. 6x-1]|uniref:PRC-barrel domain-containing protein n=1 Tax=Ancylobacter crimeensis TaxID=2579147 RepID=A0ABT0D7U8_9HYPH|nr:PRC-barrel domain-containing protein [Ancylobacter crimeensis]MCK0196030.1 PRC-barrel domain-containing protein [Ancylobacter crimeensis]